MHSGATGAQFGIVSFHLCQAILLNHFNSRVFPLNGLITA